DEEADLKYLARFAMEFCFIESCGKCAPCRIGSIRGLEILDKLLNQGRDESLISMFVDLSEVMINTSLCGLGGMAPKPILSLFKHFPEEFGLFKEDLEKFSF
ncbi:MAG: formate dehydrogenase, partial [Sulfurihydrogenibium sp.]|nr:formate dehydrogenase [Sulfurihydrogenibium sp.]